MEQTKPPMIFRGAAALGVAWNAYGVVQYIASVRATPESLIAAGLTPAQAAAMTGYPAWMTAAFAVGVFAGLAGSVLLLVRRKAALPVFALSLTGYVALFIGDATQGVFAAMGASQVIILGFVVAIAAALLGLARHGRAAGFLA